jgi:ABC-type phosphate/phosphonate transport system permease subunit
MSSGARQPLNSTAARWRRASFWLAMAGLVALAIADLDITRSSPASVLPRMGQGFLAPDFFSTDNLLRALANTLAFAWQGTALAACLASSWPWPGIIAGCEALRPASVLSTNCSGACCCCRWPD